MPRSRFNELIRLAEEHDGLFTSMQARRSGFTNSVLARLTQRGRLERTARGVYRIPYIPINRLSQYREAVLWAQAHRGPALLALSHETALTIYQISDANPGLIHLTVPRAARLRRRRAQIFVIHRCELNRREVTMIEGLPVTSIERTVKDLLQSGSRLDLVSQAIRGARREGYISAVTAQRLRRRLKNHVTRLRVR